MLAWWEDSCSSSTTTTITTTTTTTTTTVGITEQGGGDAGLVGTIYQCFTFPAVYPQQYFKDSPVKLCIYQLLTWMFGEQLKLHRIC